MIINPDDHDDDHDDDQRAHHGRHADDDVLRQARAGDPDAFGSLFAAHRSSALRVATVVLGSPGGADDVVQDAVIRAWRGVAGLEDVGRFRPWFLHIVANTARNARRSTGRRAVLALRAAGQRSSDAVGPEEVVVSDDERRTVLAAMNRLGRDDRVVLALRHFEQLSEAEIGEVLGCPVGTVKSRLSRATARLRRKLRASAQDASSSPEPSSSSPAGRNR